MKALVVYESMFGNTEQVALAVAKGLGSLLEVDTVEVGAATPPAEDVDLVVVGGPTHAFGMSRESTRRSAVDQAPNGVVSAKGGIREWLDGLPAARPGALAAAFDTHVDKPRWLPGSAARAAGKGLRRHGYRLGVPPESFYVTGTPGPLLDGELDRARQWGEQLGAVTAAG